MEKVSSGKIGRYEIIKVLGRGGMGEVILAQDENLGRRVAIKRPFKSAVAEGLARFQVEAKAATLRHPNIPAVYEMGVHDDLPFIAMEFVEGETLEKIIDARRDVDLIGKLKIIEQVCSALGYAHDNGIIHRDIKPANIIVQPDGVAKIIDFGIAKLQDEDPNSGLTKASQLIGSLHYIAPERFYGGKVDGRADLFSVGVTLFKLLTGKEPFTGGEATASFKIMNETHTGLSAYLHDYPPVLDEIVAKSLAKNPDDRYQTGEDFADALHEVTEDLKRTRVTELFSDAERLTTERRFAPALELLDEAIKLDPAHTQARKLRKFVREHQERIRRAERLRECLLKSDEALLSGNFEEALNQLKDAQNLDSSSEEIKNKIQAVEDKKRRFESSTRALAEAERVKARGDVTGAMRIVTRALEEDPDNKRLLSLNSTLQRQMEIEAQRGRLLELQENATRALAARDWETAETLLNEALAIDPANADTDKLRRELSHARELEQRRAVLDEIQVRVQEFIRTDNYEQAADLLNRALDRLPNETLLHRLKAEVDGEARKYDVRRIVDLTIAQANELSVTSPFEALSLVQKALESIPGEERLIGYERSLRQQLDSRRSEQLRADTVLKARELMDGRQFEKAIGVLEIFEVEAGHHPDVEALLTFARDEFSRQQRTELVGRTLSHARNLIRDGRLDEAAGILEKAQQQTGDASVSTLLDEVRSQQAAAARKLEALLKRVEQLRERGELDDAIQLLQEQLTANPGRAPIQELVNSLLVERKQKQVIAIAMRAAHEAVRQNDFGAALESLQTVVHAYGETAEIASTIKDVERRRSAHAGETVGKSIESAQAALLKKDPNGALEALKIATPFLNYAGEQKQAEWQRIGQAVKKALQQAGAATGSHSIFDQQLTAIAQAKPRKTMMFIMAGAALVVLLVIGVAIWKIALVKPQGAISVQNVTPGATVTIDDVARTVDANGNVTLAVKTGTHKIVIAKDGFQTKDKSYDIEGQFTLDGTLYPKGTVLGKMQFVLPQGLSKVSVTAGGKPYGDVAPNQSIDLPVGVYPVTISAPGYQAQNLPSVAVTEASASNPVSIKVDMAKIAAGTLALHLQGGVTSVRLFVNGRPQPGEVHPNGKVTLAEGTYTLRFEALGFKPAEVPGIKVVNETETPVNVDFEKVVGASGTLSANQYSIPRGQSVTLTWETQNASAIQISGLGPVQSSGTRPVSPTTTTTYVLAAGNQQLATTTIQVTEPVKLPKVVKFEASQNAIDAGQSATLTWQVENAAAVQITELGSRPAQGSAVVYPKAKTTYALSVNDQTLSSIEVDVRTAAAPVDRPKAPETQQSLTPDRATLEKVVNAGYVSLFQRASGKGSKECQGLFNGAFGGKLHDLSQWCSLAKSFTASVQCSQVSGSGDSATLACSDKVVVIPKDGDPVPIPGQKTFRFSKGPDGNWQLLGW
jgi:eukaryotic-like serine/threonine-protein kinase